MARKNHFTRVIIPSFSVAPPVEESSSSSSGLSVSALSAGTEKLQLSDLTAVESQTGERVRCTRELDNLNAAPSLPTHPDLDAPHNKGTPGTAIDWAINFYAMVQFYDCNFREQLQSDGITQQCPLRAGGNLGDDNLCDDEGAQTSQEVVWSRNNIQGDALQRFVGWSLDTNAPESNDLEGMLVNLYDEPANSGFIDTKTRIDLIRTNGKKEVDATLFAYESDKDKPISIVRAFMKEAGSGDDVEENFITARYWDTDYKNVVVVRAHIKADAGVSVFVNKCSETTLSDALISACSAGGTPHIL